MKRDSRYGARSLEKDFPTDKACLEFIFNVQHTTACSCGGTYKRITGRKQYQCSQCRFQIAPTAGTIFHKSDTPLTLWFKAILAFSNAKSSISAKQLERELEVTYKTAWRMLMLIRKALGKKGKLSGIVEIDAGYLGGRKSKKPMSNKTVVIAAKERGGNIMASVVPDSTAITHEKFLKENVEKGSYLLSDQTHALRHRTQGYEHHTVNHSKGEYVNGPVHVNNVEAFFAHVKRSVKGVHKAISRKHSQGYLDAFAFHWNNRHSDRERFALLLGMLLQTSK